MPNTQHSQPQTQISWADMSLAQLVEWASGYILIAVGRGDFRQSVDAMVRQAYANGYNAKAAEVSPRRPRKVRRKRARRS
jgi:septal ring-binding cell division protein DamX